MGRALTAYPDWFLKNQPRPTPARNRFFAQWLYCVESIRFSKAPFPLPF